MYDATTGSRLMINPDQISATVLPAASRFLISILWFKSMVLFDTFKSFPSYLMAK